MPNRFKNTTYSNGYEVINTTDTQSMSNKTLVSPTISGSGTSAFTTVSATNLNAGASGTAGVFKIYPTTASKGYAQISCDPQTGNTKVELNFNAMGQATTITFEDPGASASYVVQSTAAITLAEANVLDAAVAGTQAASKVVLPDSNVNIGVTKVTALHIGTSGSETQVTATGAELNYLDIASLGTGAASKAVVLDAGEDYTWPASGVLTYGVLKDSAGTTITSTGAEINYLDLTTGPGTQEASKAVVADANVNIGVVKATELHIGATGSETQVTATAAELNYVDGSDVDQVVASKAVLADAAGKINLMRLGSAAASASGLLMGVGTSANPATTSTADAKFVEIRAKNTATSGDNRLGYFRFDLGGAGGSGDCIRAFTDLTAAAANATGAHFSLQADLTGYVTGQGVGCRNQLYIGNAAVPAGGTYYAAMSEFWAEGSSSDISAVTKHAIHSFQAAGDATGAATCVNALSFDGAAAADTTKMISSIRLAELPASTVGIAVLINGTRYYIPAVIDTEWN